MEAAARLIREARVTVGLTQAELAKRAGTSQPTIAAYESGAKVPSASTLERLLRALGASLGVTRSVRTLGAGHLRRLLEEKREAVLDAAARHHAGNVRVFGSVARGEETERSDIDLLVDVEPGRSLLDQVRLRRALSELLGVPVDVVSSAGVLERDRETILADAVAI
jgi:predicted nucleotidyltransferase/DNA-binding XRE family transcriptional regulator